MATIADLSDDELLRVFRGKHSPIDAFDLINAALVCHRWHTLTKSNEVWAKQLAPPAYREEDVALLKEKSPTGCRDWWCLQYWLQQEFWKEYSKRRDEQAAGGSG